MRRLAFAFAGWLAQRRAQVSLVVRFGPMTALAWVAILRIGVAERLWRVPVRRVSHVDPDIATGRSSP